MSNTINRTRLALVLALVAGVLVATFGLFGTGVDRLRSPLRPKRASVGVLNGCRTRF